MATALIHLVPEQKKWLARRARFRGKSFSQEVCDAIDLYLDIPIKSEEELSVLATEANRSADRMIRRLDETYCPRRSPAAADEKKEMSWARKAVRAIRKIVLMEDRVDRVANQVDQPAETCQDLDGRLVRLEAKFELIEKVATSRRRLIRGKSES